jgi:hypothetical protein
MEEAGTIVGSAFLFHNFVKEKKYDLISQYFLQPLQHAVSLLSLTHNSIAGIFPLRKRKCLSFYSHECTQVRKLEFPPSSINIDA